MLSRSVDRSSKLGRKVGTGGGRPFAVGMPPSPASAGNVPAAADSLGAGAEPVRVVGPVGATWDEAVGSPWPLSARDQSASTFGRLITRQSYSLGTDTGSSTGSRRIKRPP